MSEHAVISVLGDPVEIVVPSSATNHTMCVCIQTSQPGGGPPPHKHNREEEVFMVLEGEYELFDGQQWTPFRKGEIRYSVRGHFHGFRNAGTSTGRMLFIANGGCLDEYFEKISPLALPADLERFIEISNYYGYEFMPVEPPTRG